MPRLPAGDTPPRGLRASESSSSPASNRVGLAARRLRGWVRGALPDPPFILSAPPPGCPQSRLIAVRASSRGPRRSFRSRAVRRLQGAGTASPGHVWLSLAGGRLLLTAVPRAGRGGAAGALYSQEARRRRKRGAGRVGLCARLDATTVRRLLPGVWP